jgi:outer membrane protein TolC
MRRALLLPLLLSATAASAQDPPATPATAPNDAAPVRLTVEEAVTRAVAASARLSRLTALEAAAAADSKGARGERWPQLEIGAGYQRRSEVPELAIFAPTGNPAEPVQRVVVYPNIQDNWRVRAGLVMPIFTFGRVGGKVESAEQAQTAAAHDLRAGRADLVLETKTAFWDLVTSRASAALLQDAIRAYEAHIVDASNREKFGLAPRSELLAVEVERDRAELDRLRAEAGAELAEANLRRLLDLPPTARVEPVEPPAEAKAPPPDVEALVLEAQSLRSERQALLARVAAADAAARSEHGGRLPQVELSGGYLYANPNREIVPPTSDWADTWDIGVGISWKVLDGGRREANEARAHAQAEATRQELRELDRGIRLQVTQQALELRTAVARRSVAERAVVSAAESRRVAGERYRAGVIPSSELTDAEIAHERASLTLTEARAALRLAAAGLDRAVGR